MLMETGRVAGVSLALLSLALSACAVHRPLPPPPASAQTAPPKGGLYKVGTPYQIDGVWYYPAEDYNYDETGIASWYGEQFHGKYTANGETFDLNAVTAAHRTLPMPTIVEVTNLENGRSIQIRVNDRGPYARGRIIDLSRRSAQLLGFEQQGTAKVRVRILVPESIQAASLARRNGGDSDKALAGFEVPKAAPHAAVAVESLAPPPGVRVASAPPVAALPQPLPAPPPTPPVQVASAAPTTVPVKLLPVKPTQIFIQAGAFAKPDNAYRLKSRLDPLGAVKVTGVRSNGIDVYRVRLGPIPSVDEADRLLTHVVGSGLTEARIVVD
jgi:rare lipoprotein A